MFTRRQFLESGVLSLFAVQVADLAEARSAGGGMIYPGGEVGKVMSTRRTIRRFSSKGITREQLMKVLWASQGITEKQFGFRTAPSAGALYPLEISVFAGPRSVKELDTGIHRLVPNDLTLERIAIDDRRKDLASACLGQMWLARAPACLVISAAYERITAKYGKRGVRYADIESGCAAQNVFLMAVSLGLSAGIVGAFYDEKVKNLTELKDAEPLLVMPVGYRT